jgi:hypothetical protein
MKKTAMLVTILALTMLVVVTPVLATDAAYQNQNAENNANAVQSQEKNLDTTQNQEQNLVNNQAQEQNGAAGENGQAAGPAYQYQEKEQQQHQTQTQAQNVDTTENQEKVQASYQHKTSNGPRTDAAKQVAYPL